MSPLLQTFLIILAAFILYCGIGTVLHWILHQEWSGALFKKHMTHHLKLYPVSDFLSNTYRSAGKDNTVATFLVLSLPFALPLLLLALVGVITWPIFAILILEMIVVGYVHDYFHDSFHIRHHTLKRYTFFRRLTDLHYQHHVDMQTNFGIFFFGWDRVFGSFRTHGPCGMY